MSTTSRSTLINRTLRVLKKHYKPVLPAKDRNLFEHLMFACLLENSPHEAAEQVFKTFQENYFDWNEVRVSTIRELSEVTKPLVDSIEAAARLKQTLHSVFEAVYQFDLEPLKKQNIGQAAKQLQKLSGSTPYTVAYVTQQALGGHSIPVNEGLLVAMEVVGVISESEAKSKTVPGLERAISKTKGAEYSSLLHQLGVEVGRNPYGQTSRKLLLEIAPNCKSRLPKRKVPSAEPAAPPKEAVDGKGKAAAAKEAKRKPAAEPAAAGTGKKEAKPPAKKKPPGKAPKATKRPTKPGSKTPTKKKTTSHKLAKRKPR